MFTFKPFKEEDVPLLFKWLALPHVAEWWRETRDYKKFIIKYLRKIEGMREAGFFVDEE